HRRLSVGRFTILDRYSLQCTEKREARLCRAVMECGDLSPLCVIGIHQSGDLSPHFTGCRPYRQLQTDLILLLICAACRLTVIKRVAGLYPESTATRSTRSTAPALPQSA